MSTYKFNLTGWQAVAVGAVLLAVFAVRLMTFNDKKDDANLMMQIEQQLITDYFPNDVRKLKTVFEEGDVEKLDEVASSITSTKLSVESVQTSFPLFDFSTPKDVVVKVKYSLKDASGTRKIGTNYYLFRHGAIGNNWQYIYDTSVISYYLNFL